MALLKIGSMINCRGLSSDKIKRRDIFLKCRKYYDVSFLFDTISSMVQFHFYYVSMYQCKIVSNKKETS
jgi:hypothetical protein